MNKDHVMDDFGGVSKKKREKKGFKVDRYQRYQRMRLKKITGKEANNGITGGKRVKAITFDKDARREYLLTMHKQKNERRVKAFFDSKQKIKRENLKTRRAQREEARQAYNRFAAVPILPNFTYHLPREGGSDAAPEEEEQAGVDSSAKRCPRTSVVERTVHLMPAAMRGGGDVVGGAACNSRLDDEFVTVEIKPLFGRPGAAGGVRTHGTATPQLPGNNFSDLPDVVEQELIRLRKETKGPARTKPRLRIMKELSKIEKIKKHSRKGHGKKTAKGKKKNRR